MIVKKCKNDVQLINVGCLPCDECFDVSTVRLCVCESGVPTVYVLLRECTADRVVARDRIGAAEGYLRRKQVAHKLSAGFHIT